MSSVSDLIHSSFRLIGAVAAGETLETIELSDALVTLNQMLAIWSTEGTSLYGRQRITLTVFGNNTFTLPQRPVRIESASVFSGQIDSPLEIVDSVGWESIPEKQASSVYVKKLYCDYAYPTSTVFIWPVPRFSGLLEIWTYIPIVAFGSTSQVIDLPPGYEQALRYNFAVALLPEYPRAAADPSLPAQAQMYKASLVQLNATNHARSQSGSSTQSAMTDAAETAAR